MARIAIAMSGGVDSSVAALLLKKEGHQLLGLHMKLHHGEGMNGSENVAVRWMKPLMQEPFAANSTSPFMSWIFRKSSGRR